MAPGFYLVANDKHIFHCNKKIKMEKPDTTNGKSFLLSKADPSRYLSLFEQATDAIMLTDYDGNILDANESFCRMFGYTKKEVLLLNISVFILPGDLALNPIRFDLLKQGRQVLRERRMMHKDGTIIYVEANVKKCDEDTVMAIARNITERKNTSEAFEKEKIFSDTIINTLPGLFFVREVPGKVIRWNKNLEKVLGYTSDEISDMPLLGIIAEEDKERIGKKIEEAIRAGAADAEACVVTKHGEKIPYYFSAISIINDGIPCILGSAIDISARIKAEKLLEEEKQSRQREITEAVITGAENERQVIGRELHDNINQLLAGALMYNRLYQDTLESPNALLTESAKQVNNAINEIRSLSHALISPFLQEQPFNEALEKIIDVLRKSGIDDIYIDIRNFDDKLITPKLKITLFRIIQEQFNNIMKHSGATKISLTIKQEDQKLTLSIKDNGFGFDISKKHPGIGLINIKTRASLFNGTTRIISSPGKGSELHVAFN